MKIVVIGASAGGSKALAELLGYLSASFPLPIVVVKHHKSGDEENIAEWLNRRVALDVHIAEDKEPFRPGSVMLAPPDYHLLVGHGEAELLMDEPVSHARPAVDVLFESAAFIYGDQAVGVVLTGASRDGAKGAEDIRAAGGRVFVQNPDTAEVSVMPRAALGKSDKGNAMELDCLATKLVELAND
ncbi:chemotaxis protein CheB [Sansalvadorimonas verongulae]|uniref:chemotaxis protein CheB n=1 Tax=Sansalvadorimonas verongulae TaxID=2172824 RepID=UPI0012BBFF08|nr:chemotaxis protein CheB [Sansalvadorimonas verongulae]MTI14619.1 chemotaxis protein CheB [Sansalvadorimonas verongulae]